MGVFHFNTKLFMKGCVKMSAKKPPFLGVAYYPEDWDESELDHDIEKMHHLGIDTVRIAEFAWHRMEPHPGVFDFSFFHRVTERMHAAGIHVVLGTPTATPPRWLGKQYPEIFTEREDGNRAEHGGRRHCCSNNPVYNEYSLRIVEKMAQEFADDPAVIGWQIDNEIYAGEGGGCFCPICQKKFREKLRAQYGTIDALNRAWNLNLFSQWYDDFEDIPAPRRAWHNPHLIQAWNIFQNDSHIEFVGRQADILHKYVQVPVGTDTMPFNGMDYRRMTEKLDIVQFNHYNVPENLHCCAFWFDYLRTLKDRPFWNTETATCWNGSTAISQSIKPEGYCRVNSWMPIALGGEANMYWLWRTHWAGHELVHGAVIDSSGRPMHIDGEVAQTAADFEKASDWLNGTRVASDIAIHFTSLSWTMHAAQNVVAGWNYQGTVQENIYRPLLEMGVRPDVIDAAQPLEKYRLIFTPMVMTLEEHDLGKRMAEWVRNGGTWVVGPLTDVRNLDGARYQHCLYGMLEELTGVRWLYAIPDTEGHITAQWTDGTPFQGSTWFEVSEPAEETLVSVTGGHSSLLGKSLVYQKKVGKGKVILLGSVPSPEDMKKLMNLVCTEDKIRLPHVSGKLIVSPRTGEAGEGIILIEYGNQEGSFCTDTPVTDLLTGEQLHGEIRLRPYDVKVLKKN